MVVIIVLLESMLSAVPLTAAVAHEQVELCYNTGSFNSLVRSYYLVYVCLLPNDFPF